MNDLTALTRFLRAWSLQSTSLAQSGHPSSCLSAAEIVATLFFGENFHFDLSHPESPVNDRFILSKGHAAPLLYAAWAAAGAFPPEELKKLRTLESPLEGHPTPEFPFSEVPTGSLGQGLSAGVGMALSARIDESPSKVFVLLGDSEMSEGSNWEAMEIAAHYKLHNLIGIIDVNRLGQRGETMSGHDLASYQQKAEAFGWKTVVVEDGHSLDALQAAYQTARAETAQPTLIIAQTFKGRGVSLLENREGWHGKTLSEEQLSAALNELGEIDWSARGTLATPKPHSIREEKSNQIAPHIAFEHGQAMAPRAAYGQALVRVTPAFPHLHVLDAEVSNSTMSEIFQKTYPEKFWEMFIAEQNMVGAALGLAARGKLPFVSTFGAFFTRAADQIRMAGYSKQHIVFCGGHVGVSIGKDGFSQMGLEDISLFRTVRNSTVLIPADAVAMDNLVERAAGHRGCIYLRSTREKLPLLYQPGEKFPIGGSKTLRQTEQDQLTIIGAGITVHEALAAAHDLHELDIHARVIDLYSIKPIDAAALHQAARETGKILVVEDHYPEGGVGEAVRSALESTSVEFMHLAIRQTPHSASPRELMDYEGISARAIIHAAKKLVSG